MPQIKFSNLPPDLLNHLADRVQERKISYADLVSLERWKASKPSAPEGNWYKRFRGFILSGTSEFPKTILTPDMQPYGQEIE